MIGTRRLSGWEVAADLGLLALALGTTASFTRLFIGWSFFSRLLPVVVLAWLVPLVLRHLGAGLAVALAVHSAVGVVLLTVTFAPGTHLLGVPTPDTLRALSRTIETSFAEFSELVAPVPATPGFLVVIAACLWIFGFFLGTAAQRFRGAVQAAVPHTALFVTVGVLARTSGRTAAVVAFGGGLLAYAVTQTARSSTGWRWMPQHLGRGTASLTARAAATGAVALVAAAVVAPMAAPHDPLVDLRELGRGDGPRTVVSPFVGLRSLLGQRSDEVVFTVESEQPAYWRLTALEEFDAQRHIWVSSGTYSAVRSRLPAGDASEVRPGATLHQEFEVRGLGGIWLPGAYVPTRIAADVPVGYDPGSASLMRRDDDPEREVRYSLESQVPDFGALERFGLPRGADHRAGVRRVHLEVPDLGVAVDDALASATAGANDDRERLLALQGWFRSRFAYDESVDYSGESDPLAAFLAQRRGFCQQFSSAFALMARRLGLPSRVAVGFTPGDPQPNDDQDDARTRFVVRGRHAHAWPEVHLAGYGWVPFEPTPQRGDPQGVEHTGVAPDQADPPDEQATTTTISDEGPPSTTTPGGAPPTTGELGTGAGGRAPEDADARPLPWWVMAAGALAVAAVVAVLVLRRRRSGVGATADPARAAVSGSWQRAVSTLQRAGCEPRASETPVELARRLATELGPVTEDLEPATAEQLVDALDALGALARLETRARYGREAPTDDERTAAADAAQVVTQRAAALRGAQASSSERRRRSLARDPALLK